MKNNNMLKNGSKKKKKKFSTWKNQTEKFT